MHCGVLLVYLAVGAIACVSIVAGALEAVHQVLAERLRVAVVLARCALVHRHTRQSVAGVPCHVTLTSVRCRCTLSCNIDISQLPVYPVMRHVDTTRTAMATRIPKVF